jgi:multidrug efflux pump subunit AcrA (membrane-fusion protein)
MKKIFTLLVVSLSLIASSTIKISKKQQDDLGVKTQKVTIVNTISVGPYNGLVSLDKNDIISIGSSVDAVVKNIYVRKLEHVKKGQKLLSIKSNELLNLQEEYIKSLIQSVNADKNYERNKKLQEDGIISLKKLLESLQDKQSIDLRVKLSANELLSSGFNVAMLQRVKKTHQPILSINILAPRDAIVNNIEVNIGEKVESNRSMMSLFADGKRFIELSVPVKSLEHVSLEQKCLFASYSAKITAIGNIVNTQSQSVQVRALIQDAKDIMINRVYSVEIIKNISGTVKIKKSALVFEDNKAYIFKKISTGFAVVPVQIIKEGDSCYILKANLKDDDYVAVSSTSALLSAMDISDE